MPINPNLAPFTGGFTTKEFDSAASGDVYSPPSKWGRSEVASLKYSEGQDPKKVLLDALKGAHDNVEFIGGGVTKILVATAPHCEKSKGGIIYSDFRIDQGRFQGKVGLVVAKGPASFKSTKNYEYNYLIPEIGDWIFYKPSDGWEVAVNGVPCRFIDDDCVIGRISDIEAIY